MLRSFFIYISKARWAKQMVTRWNFAWRTASRFVAGEKLEDAIQAVKALNEKGIMATLDHLGEHTSSLAKAREATDAVLEIIETIDRAEVKSNVSIKLTQIGLALDEELCAENLKCILECAQKHETFVRIDMEDSPWVDKTLNLNQKMREACTCENLGVVIQSYLYRSVEDVSRLMEEETRVRLCKGAYKEPADIAFPKKKDVDDNFDRLTEMLIEGAKAAGSPHVSQNGKIPPIPAIATHDEKRIKHARAYADEVGLPKQAIEFQMLYGIRRDFQEQLTAAGYPVRVYVPYGSEWYPYFTRRLAERPANLWFFISNLVRR
jgi:proline dehydrogenase